MIFSDRIRHAINVSALAHKGQDRKFQKVPYVSHPFGVAFILTSYTENEDVVIAALLHDILEDVDSDIYNAEGMRKDFGNRVLELVSGVTEDKAILDYKQRKQAYLDHLAASDQETMLLSAADFTHNMASLADDIHAIGIEAWRGSADPESRRWFYRERCQVLKAHLESDLVDEMEAAYRRVAELIGA